MTVQWLYEGQRVAETQRVRQRMDAANSLDIASVEMADSGTYTCVAYGPESEARVDYQLTVRGKRRQLPARVIS